MLLVSNFHLSLIFQENKMQANHICLYIHNLHIHTRMCPHPHAYTYIYMCPCWHTQLCLTVCGPMDYCLSGSSVHGILQASILEYKNTCHFLLQGIFPTQGSNSCLLQVSYIEGFFTT